MKKRRLEEEERKSALASKERAESLRLMLRPKKRTYSRSHQWHVDVNVCGTKFIICPSLWAYLTSIFAGAGTAGEETLLVVKLLFGERSRTLLEDALSGLNDGSARGCGLQLNAKVY